MSRELEADEPPQPKRRQANHLGRVAQILLFAGVVFGVFVVVLPHLADFDQVWAAVRSMTWWQYVVLVAATAWNIVTYWPVTMAGMPGLSLAKAAVVNQSSTSVAMTVPGGGAVAVGVTYAMFRSWGFRRSEIALQALVTGIWNIFLRLILPVVALVVLAVHGGHNDALVTSAVIAVLITAAALMGLGLSLSSARFAELLGSLAGWVASSVRGPLRRRRVEGWGSTAVRFRAQLLELLRRRWAFLTAATIVSHGSIYVVMLVSLRFVGVSDGEVNWAQALAVFALVRLASSVPIIPGNVGLAELGYVAGLVLVGADRAEAVAAVLVFRFLTYYAQIPIGALTYVAWRRKRGWRKEAEIPKGPASMDDDGVSSALPGASQEGQAAVHPGG